MSGILVPKADVVTDLAGAVREAQAQLRGNALRAAGLSTKTYDPTTLTEADVTALVRAQARRQKKRAKARAIAGA
jgi:hypothetical protein